MDTFALTREEVERSRSFNYGVPRNHLYPSLSTSFLSAYQRCTMHGFYSARFLAVLKDMQEVLKDDPFAKFVIFSQYSTSLHGLKDMFENVDSRISDSFEVRIGGIDMSRVRYDAVIIDGHGNKTTDTNLAKFRNDPKCNICLLTTGVAATGLTLTMSYTCYILEPTHNAAEEAQALSRVHRIGQSSRCVRCVIFYGEDSSEERLLALRQKMGTLSSHFSVDNESQSMFPGKRPSEKEGNNRRKRRKLCNSEDEYVSDESSDVEELDNEDSSEEVGAVSKASQGMFNSNQLRSILGVSEARIASYRQQNAAATTVNATTVNANTAYATIVNNHDLVIAV